MQQFPSLSDRDLLGSIEQVAEVRLVRVEDGIEAGNRILQFRACGLAFDVQVDRGFDIGRAEAWGRPVGWRGHAGFPHPMLLSNDTGLEPMRIWGGGLVMTGGLDHAFGPARSSAKAFNYPWRDHQEHPMHGRTWFTPAQIRSYGTNWVGERLTCFAEGEVHQASAFGEHLVLIRRIEAVAGEGAVTIRDRVVNLGSAPTSHMFLYHLNFGAPLVEPGTRVVGDLIDPIPLGGASGSPLLAPEPLPGESERVFLHRTPSGRAVVKLINDRRAMEASVEVQSDQFPYFLVWQSVGPRSFGLGLEPSTNAPFGRDAAADAEELIVLEPDEVREYDLRLAFTVEQR